MHEIEYTPVRSRISSKSRSLPAVLYPSHSELPAQFTRDASNTNREHPCRRYRLMRCIALQSTTTTSESHCSKGEHRATRCASASMSTRKPSSSHSVPRKRANQQTMQATQDPRLLPLCSRYSRRPRCDVSPSEALRKQSNLPTRARRNTPLPPSTTKSLSQRTADEGVL